jgi:hypothetical protein
MEGTLTNSLNQRLSHACDVKVPIEIAVAWARLQNGTLMTALTAAIKSIAASLGSDPSGLVSTAINILKKLQSYLRWIQSILQEIQDWAKVIIRYAQIAKAIIDFINSLPDKIRRFLSNCIAKIISGIMSVIGALFATDGLPSFEVGELFTEFNNTLTELGKTGKEVLQTAALPGQFVEALINPSSQQDQSKAEKILGGVISSVKDNGTAINNQVQYKRENGVP